MQISFTGGFLANGGILKRSWSDVNSNGNLAVYFAESVRNPSIHP